MASRARCAVLTGMIVAVASAVLVGGALAAGANGAGLGGTVTGPGNTPLGGVEVCVDSEFVFQCATTNNAGAYSIDAGAGTYAF